MGQHQEVGDSSRENKLHFIFKGFWGQLGCFYKKAVHDQGRRNKGQGLHCESFGEKNSPLVIPGERCSLSLCRRLLRSRDPCLAGWGGWPSNMLTMSIRSILFRAVYKLSTAEKSHVKEKGFGSRNWCRMTEKVRKQQSGIILTHSWLSCPHGWPTGWAVQSSAPTVSWDSPHGSYWCHLRWAAALAPTLFRNESEIQGDERNIYIIFSCESCCHSTQSYFWDGTKLHRSCTHMRLNSQSIKQLWCLAEQQEIISLVGWLPCYNFV